MSRLFLAIPLFLATALAQQFQSNSVRVSDGVVTGIYGPPRAVAVVAGAPYAAEQLQEYTALGENAPSRSNIIGQFARDSHGRTRITRAMKPAAYSLTEIFDPVAGVAYLLDEDARIAHRMPLGTPAPVPSFSSRPGVTRESLGTRSIDGVRAEGMRIVGPLTIETWTSPELKVDLMVRSSNGYTSRMINVNRNEPDAALFQPPTGYRVIDEIAPFPMTIHTR